MDEFDRYASLVQDSVNQNNAWSAQQAQKQMDFQREMSNTAHQREVADLKAAGLNPVLSAKLGGASTPSGAMAQGDTSGTSALVNLLTLSMETANSAAGAAAGLAGVGSGSSTASIFGLNPSDYLIKNPRNALQLGWNALMNTLISQGVNVNMQDLLSLAGRVGLNFNEIFGNTTVDNSASKVSRVGVKKPDGVFKNFANGLAAVISGNYKQYAHEQEVLRKQYYYALARPGGSGKSQNR